MTEELTEQQKLTYRLNRIEHSLAKLEKLQELELQQIKLNRQASNKRINAAINTIKQLIALVIVVTAGAYAYSELPTSAKEKASESFLNQAIPILLAGFSGHMLLQSRGNKNKEEEEEEEAVDTK